MAVSQTKHCYSLKVKIFGPPNFGLGAGAQPALHFGGGAIFMKYHSMMSSCGTTCFFANGHI